MKGFNPYNKKIFLKHQANMDIQFVFNSYGVKILIHAISDVYADITKHIDFVVLYRFFIY